HGHHRQGQALGGQGDLHPVRHAVVHDGSRHQARHGGVPMSKTTRQSTVESLTRQIKDSPNLFVTDFSGLNVMKMTEFRRRLREAGARYVVVKNTLAQRALAENSIAELDGHLSGSTGFVLTGEDPMAAAKVLGDF